MDAFAHLSVLISIILGLAITQLLQSVRGIVLGRARIRVYWVPVAWAMIVLVICVQSWWAMFGLRYVRDWTFTAFAVVLLQVIATYMQAAFVIPDLTRDEPIDLRAHYYGHLRWFFGALIVTLAASLAKDLVLSGHLPARANLLFHLGMMVASVVAASTHREWFHKINVVAAGCIIGIYILLLFMQLR